MCVRVCSERPGGEDRGNQAAFTREAPKDDSDAMRAAQ